MLWEYHPVCPTINSPHTSPNLLNEDCCVIPGEERLHAGSRLSFCSMSLHMHASVSLPSSSTQTNNALLWFLPCSRRPGSRQREPAICPPTLPCDPEHSPQYEVIHLLLSNVTSKSTRAQALFHWFRFFLFFLFSLRAMVACAQTHQHCCLSLKKSVFIWQLFENMNWYRFVRCLSLVLPLLASRSVWSTLWKRRLLFSGRSLSILLPSCLGPF